MLRPPVGASVSYVLYIISCMYCTCVVCLDGTTTCTCLLRSKCALAYVPAVCGQRYSDWKGAQRGKVRIWPTLYDRELLSSQVGSKLCYVNNPDFTVFCNTYTDVHFTLTWAIVPTPHGFPPPPPISTTLSANQCSATPSSRLGTPPLRNCPLILIRPMRSKLAVSQLAQRRIVGVLLITLLSQVSHLHRLVRMGREWMEVGPNPDQLIRSHKSQQVSIQRAITRNSLRKWTER